MKTASGATFSDSNKMISFTDITKVTQLELAGCNITNISQLSNFNSLIKLNLANNNIEDISALSELSNLQVLDLYKNSIEDVTPLKELTSLTELDLHNNKVSDISSLNGLGDLTFLNLVNNSIANIDVIKYFTKLQVLRLSQNKITSIASITKLNNLSDLSIDRNLITDLSLLKNIKNYDLIDEYHYFNDLKKSGLVSNWDEFANEISNYSITGYTVNHTNDSLTLSKDGEELIKLTRNNNILRYSGSSASIVDFINLLFTIDYDIDDVNNYIEVDENHGLIWDIDFLAKSQIDMYKDMLSKFNDKDENIDYVSFDATYGDDGNMDTVEFTLDMDYFFNYRKTVNPYTGVSNVLVLIGITLMCSAIGFIVLYKHKTGIQL